MTAAFSLLHLREANPELYQYFVWPEDDWPGITQKDAYIHMGCESHVLPGFVNLDFLPAHAGVLQWEALSPWPERLNNSVKVFYSEDFIEHFFLNEQLYLYCSMNCLLRDDGIVRTLTPNMDSLWRYGQQFNLEDCLSRGDDYFVSIMRCRDGMDAVNMGMRMGGHRWLHTPESLSRVARICGFTPHAASCATSSDPKLCGINLRMEYGNGISFALEMKKCRSLIRLQVPPAKVLNAEQVEALSTEQQLYRAVNNDPAVLYDFAPLDVNRIALVNIRGANVSQYREHNFAKCYFRLCEAGGLYSDRTLQSAPYMNLYNSVDIQSAMASQTTLASLRFDPGEREGEYFTTGPLEIFYFGDAPKQVGFKSKPYVQGESLQGLPVLSDDIFRKAKVFRCRQGNMLSFSFDQPVARSLELYGEWAQREIDTMRSLIPQGGMVLDAGAHVGVHTISFAQHVGSQGQVLAVEPRGDLFHLLVENIRRNGLEGMAMPKQMALSDTDGTLYVPVSEGDRPQNLAATNLREKGPGQAVPCVTIDSMSVERLDFIKIDAEGQSAAVLRGASDSIKRFRPIVALECADFMTAAGSLGLLQEWDYRFFHVAFFAYNQENFHAESWNIFGMAQESMLFAVPCERLSQHEALLKSMRPITNEMDLMRALVCTLPYGGVPLRGNEPWYLVSAWAEERRQRSEEELNELFSALRAQWHAERAQKYFSDYAERNDFLCTLQMRHQKIANNTSQEKKVDPLLDHILVKRLQDLLACPIQTDHGRDIKPFQIPPPPEPEAWENLAVKRHSVISPRVDVIVPVYNAARHTEACLHSVLSASCETPFQLIVIDDASTDTDLARKLERLAQLGLVELIRHPENLGFVRSANEGMSAHEDRDIVLLNSDTLVFDGWLDRLRQHALEKINIGTVTALSNNATIYSYPSVPLNSSHALYADPAEIDHVSHRIHPGKSMEIPTAVGFCMYIRRSCIKEVGLFDAELFDQGYGEENDFCLRAAARGWTHRIALDVYVWHEGEVSFSFQAANCKHKAYVRLCEKYPDYKQSIQSFLRQNPLLPYFNRLSYERLHIKSYRNDRKAILFVAHNWGGGTEREMQAMAELLYREDIPVLVMRPAGNFSQCRISLNSPDSLLGPEEMSFALPEELGALVKTLRCYRVAHMHIHCLAGYHAAMPDALRLVCRMLQIDYDFLASDFLCVCPRAHAVRPNGKYCGVPEAWKCGQCLEESVPWCGMVDMPRWRKRYARFIYEARRLFVPSHYMASCIQQWFPQCQPLVRPYPELHVPDQIMECRRRRGDEDLHIIVIGAIGEHKGMQNLLACARDARNRRLPLRFTVMGYTCDDSSAQALGINVTGRYKDKDALQQLTTLDGHMAFLPSIWPETYCYTLSVAVLAGLFPVVFDLGAQAERVKSWDWGLVLSKDLNGAGTAINNALLACSIPEQPEDMLARIAAAGNFGQDYFTGYYDLPLSVLEML